MIRPPIPPIEVEAKRYAFAAGVTNFTHKRALDVLSKGLKTGNLLSKETALYPMLGVNEMMSKLNFINPRDSNIGFRLTFVAYPTMSYRGVDWNGTTQYANTNLTASLNLSATTNHLSYYSRENTQLSTPQDIGIADSTNGIIVMCVGRSFDNLIFYEQGGAYVPTTSSVISRAGFFDGVRTAAGSSNLKMYRNGADMGATYTADGTPAALAALPVFIGCGNTTSGVPLNFTNRQCAFAAIGLDFSSTEIAIRYKVIQIYQTVLWGRQV